MKCIIQFTLLLERFSVCNYRTTTLYWDNNQTNEPYYSCFLLILSKASDKVWFDVSWLHFLQKLENFHVVNFMTFLTKLDLMWTFTILNLKLTMTHNMLLEIILAICQCHYKQRESKELPDSWCSRHITAGSLSQAPEDRHIMWAMFIEASSPQDTSQFSPIIPRQDDDTCPLVTSKGHLIAVNN